MFVSMSLDTSTALIPVTRVMSPTPVPHDSILTDMRTTCLGCHSEVHNPAVCAGCGVYGHPWCLHLEGFLGYPFCATCIPRVTAEYVSFQNAQRREAWQRSLETQIGTWKARAIETIGLSSTIGVVGGVVVAAAGAAAGLAHGAVRGAAEASSVARPAPPRAVVPSSLAEPPGSRAGSPSDHPGAGPQAATTTTTPKGTRTPGRCPMCWNPGLGSLRPIQHTFQGDCRLTPEPPAMAGSTRETHPALTPGATVLSTLSAAAALAEAMSADTTVPRLLRIRGIPRGRVASAADAGSIQAG